jgi:hypothetical protein
MRKKLQFIAQTMLLLLLPAFIMRPVMVTVGNSFQASDKYPAQKSLCDSHQDLVAGHATFRPIARENTPQIPVLSPCYTKTILASSEGRDLQFASNAVSFSPQGFHVLRI